MVKSSYLRLTVCDVISRNRISTVSPFSTMPMSCTVRPVKLATNRPVAILVKFNSPTSPVDCLAPTSRLPKSPEAKTQAIPLNTGPVAMSTITAILQLESLPIVPTYLRLTKLASSGLMPLKLASLLVELIAAEVMEGTIVTTTSSRGQLKSGIPLKEYAVSFSILSRMVLSAQRGETMMNLIGRTLNS